MIPPFLMSISMMNSIPSRKEIAAKSLYLKNQDSV